MNSEKREIDYISENKKLENLPFDLSEKINHYQGLFNEVQKEITQNNSNENETKGFVDRWTTLIRNENIFIGSLYVTLRLLLAAVCKRSKNFFENTHLSFTSILLNTKPREGAPEAFRILL